MLRFYGFRLKATKVKVSFLPIITVVLLKGRNRISDGSETENVIISAKRDWNMSHFEMSHLTRGFCCKCHTYIHPPPHHGSHPHADHLLSVELSPPLSVSSIRFSIISTPCCSCSVPSLLHPPSPVSVEDYPPPPSAWGLLTITKYLLDHQWKDQLNAEGLNPLTWRRKKSWSEVQLLKTYPGDVCS